MSLIHEIDRHIDKATPSGKRYLRPIRRIIESLIGDGIMPELPRGTTFAGRAEPLVLPTTDQLMTASHAYLRGFFGIEMEIAEPPQELFSDIRKLAEMGVRVSTPDIYATPYFKFRRNIGKDEVPGWQVRPHGYFWDLIDTGNLPQDAATLQAAWHIDLDPKGKPEYNNGQQMYWDDYLAKYMAGMRRVKLIEGYEGIPDGSRFGASPDQIEGVIVPVFNVITGVEGELNYKPYMGYNFRGNKAHFPWSETETAEWFKDKVGINSGRRLVGGSSKYGGLGFVGSWPSSGSGDDIGFSLEIVYLSQSR